MVRDAWEIPEAQLRRLVEIALGPRPTGRSSTFWAWKHQANPFGVSPGLVAMAGEEAVSLRLFLRWALESSGQPVSAVRAVDTATHPDHRGRGLFRRLTTRLVDELSTATDLVFNTPNPRSAAGYLKMGWVKLGRAPLLLRPLPSRGLLRQPVGFEASLPVPLQPIDKLLEEPWLAEALAAPGAGDPRLQTRRSVEYLRWRYLEIPEISYGALWECSPRGKAVIVARPRLRRKLREIAIAEVLTAGAEGPRIAARLLGRLARRARAHYLVACAAPRAAEREALSRAWFLPLPLGPRVYARRLASEELPIDPLDIRNWRLSLGDLEVF